eukprot:NP_498246.1 Uncharacterized protein CELE_B0244.11 [Caenorhabditis elegans]
MRKCKCANHCFLSLLLASRFHFKPLLRNRVLSLPLFQFVCFISGSSSSSFPYSQPVFISHTSLTIFLSCDILILSSNFGYWNFLNQKLYC